ncbi:MAG: archaeal proteasome endopeptidase complex subunit beta [Candidatus Ranarchaeia archaeon]
MAQMDNNSKFLTTGTSTLGLVCKDGIVMATDSQATMGYLVASMEAPKLFKISDYIGVTIAGGVADCQKLVDQVRALSNLRSIELNRRVTVKSIAMVTSNILHQNRYYPLLSQLIIGGVDESGSRLFSLDPLGSLLEESKFVATGSGSVMIYGVLEEDYNEEMTTKEGVELAKKAITASRKRDIASGGNLQIAIITDKGYNQIQ